MERDVVFTLRSSGHRVTILPLGDDLADQLDRTAPDVVFNMTEHMDGDRTRAGDVTTLLEKYGFAYTGAAALGQTLSNDKAASKRIVRAAGMLVPEFEVLPIGRTGLRRRLRFPVIVKPRFGDGSEGITLRSVSYSDGEVADNVKAIHRNMRQPAICETFIDGRELTVGIVGDTRLTSFPASETVYGTWRPGAPRFNATIVKSSPAFRERYQMSSVRAELPGALHKLVRQQCKEAFQRLALRDYARIDLRLDTSGNLYFIEANCNCDLKEGAFGTMAQWAGIEYSALLERIVRDARRRGPRRKRR